MKKNIYNQDQIKESDLDFELIKSEEEDRDIDIAPYKINTYGADYTLEILAQKLKTKEIKTPTFQRRYVWSLIRASKLIESFLLGLPVPQIFLYREINQDLLVVDGQQRLKSIFYFFNGKFDNGKKFILKTVKPRWEGKTFEKLEEIDKRRIKNSVLRATIFEQQDPKDNSSIFEIFERLNTGGMALNEQEVRNCVIRGEINKFLEELNNYQDWRRLLNKESPDTRMKDIEMILRFFSLYKDKGWQKYKKPMKDFITEFMRNNRDIDEEHRIKYENLFKGIIKKIYKDVGVSAFRLKSGINVALFDAVVVALASTKNYDKIQNLKTKIEKLKKNNKFIYDISNHTTDTDRVLERIRMTLKIFSQ